jgi:hypothetical protein
LATLIFRRMSLSLLRNFKLVASSLDAGFVVGFLTELIKLAVMGRLEHPSSLKESLETLQVLLKEAPGLQVDLIKLIRADLCRANSLPPIDLPERFYVSVHVLPCGFERVPFKAHICLPLARRMKIQLDDVNVIPSHAKINFISKSGECCFTMIKSNGQSDVSFDCHDNFTSFSIDTPVRAPKNRAQVPLMKISGIELKDGVTKGQFLSCFMSEQSLLCEPSIDTSLILLDTLVSVSDVSSRVALHSILREFVRYTTVPLRMREHAVKLLARDVFLAELEATECLPISLIHEAVGEDEPTFVSALLAAKAANPEATMATVVKNVFDPSSQAACTHGHGSIDSKAPTLKFNFRSQLLQCESN